MRGIGKFIRATVLGGALIVLPIWLTVLLLLKLLTAATAALLPIAKTLTADFRFPNLVALGLLLGLCVVAGLLARTPPGRKGFEFLGRRVLDRVPGYTFLRGLSRQMADQDADAFRPALAEMEGGLVVSFVVDEHEGGWYSIFVPSAPTPAVGAVYLFPRERVHIIDVPVPRVIQSITKWGSGSKELITALLKRDGHFPRRESPA